MNFMVNQMNKLQKNRKNKNKGFTLVELIIVIAIIAVLAAVLAPQYIRYVEKSRIGVDESYISEVAHNMEMIAASNEPVSKKTVTVTIDAAGKMTVVNADGTDDDKAVEILTDDLIGTDSDPGLFPTAKQTFKSNYYTKTGHTVSLVLKVDGSVSISNTDNLDRA